jgi:hypothetical protein
MKAIRKTVAHRRMGSAHIYFIFALSGHIGFTALAASSPSRSRQQCAMLTIIADKLSAAGWFWGYCSALMRDGWRRIVNAHREVAATLPILTNC